MCRYLIAVLQPVTIRVGLERIGPAESRHHVGAVAIGIRFEGSYACVDLFSVL
jgi:hypothetical protein